MILNFHLAKNDFWSTGNWGVIVTLLVDDFVKKIIITYILREVNMYLVSYKRNNPWEQWITHPEMNLPSHLISSTLKEKISPEKFDIDV